MISLCSSINVPIAIFHFINLLVVNLQIMDRVCARLTCRVRIIFFLLLNFPLRLAEFDSSGKFDEFDTLYHK